MLIDYIHGYLCGYSWWIIVKPIEFLGKTITDHDPILFFRIVIHDRFTQKLN